MKKPIQIFYMMILTVFILLPVVFFAAFKDHFDTKNYENRTLAEAPVLSLNRASIEAFPTQFTDWFEDHLPFRNQILTATGLLDYKFFKCSSSDTVIIGKDGWLFYKGLQVQAEDPVSDYMGTNLFTEEELKQIAKNMTDAQELLAEKGSKFVIFMAPNKERIFYEYMPDCYGLPAEQNRLQQVQDYLRANTDIPVVDCYDELMRFKEDQDYFKYDTHWNELGAYRGARMLAQELGFELPTMDIVKMEDYGQGNFDLARMIHLGQVLKFDHAYDITNYTPYRIEDEKNDASTEFRFHNPNGDGSDEKLMIIGDSFSMLLSPFVASNYNNSYVTFYYNYNYQMLEEEAPDIVVYETVERYIGNMTDFSLTGGIGANLRG